MYGRPIPLNFIYVVTLTFSIHSLTGFINLPTDRFNKRCHALYRLLEHPFMLSMPSWDSSWWYFGMKGCGFWTAFQVYLQRIQSDVPLNTFRPWIPCIQTLGNTNSTSIWLLCLAMIIQLFFLSFHRICFSAYIRVNFWRAQDNDDGDGNIKEAGQWWHQ